MLKTKCKKEIKAEVGGVCSLLFRLTQATGSSSHLAVPRKVLLRFPTRREGLKEPKENFITNKCMYLRNGHKESLLPKPTPRKWGKDLGLGKHCLNRRSLLVLPR